MRTAKCKYCNKKFIQKRKGHNYCSKECQFSNWKSINYKYYRHLISKHYFKIKLLNPIICRYCGKKLKEIERKCGKQYHNSCQKLQRNKTQNNFSIKVHKLFIKYKEQIGCSKCGYKKCGACLDFHHILPDKKLRRITAKHWYSKSKTIKIELKKCILLCKNCHYELHYKGNK